MFVLLCEVFFLNRPDFFGFYEGCFGLNVNWLILHFGADLIGVSIRLSLWYLVFFDLSQPVLCRGVVLFDHSYCDEVTCKFGLFGGSIVLCIRLMQ